MSGIEPSGGGRGSGGDGVDFDTDELRRRMHEAVNHIEPAGDSLERLRHAVPARRRRRSAVMAGTSALAFVAICAVATHGAPGWVASVTRSVERTATIGGAGGASEQGNGTNGSSASEQQGRTGGAGDPSVSASGTANAGESATTPTPRPSLTMSPRPGSPALPPCGAAMLSQPTIATDSVVNGVTYGHVDGTVQKACNLAEQPSVAVVSTESSAPTVATVPNSSAHYQGLPDVTSTASTIALTTGSSYEFQFAWVPASCPSAQGSSSEGTGADSSQPPATPTPTDSPTAQATTYQLSYTATANGPTGTMTLSAACGATVYVTDVYNGGQYPLATSTP
jgi:hypothetical protein